MAGLFATAARAVGLWARRKIGGSQKSRETSATLRALPERRSGESMEVVMRFCCGARGDRALDGLGHGAGGAAPGSYAPRGNDG